MKTSQLFLLASALGGAAWITIPPTTTAPPTAEPFVIAEAPLPVVHTAAVRKTPAPVIAPATVASPLEAALSAGDVCETARLVNALPNVAPMYTAFLAAISPSPELRESFGPDGPMQSANVAARKYQSLPALTLQALKLAGILEGGASAPTDLPGARALLLDLEKREPGNSFYPLFRFYVEKRLDYPPEKLDATVKLLAEGSSFDSHVGQLDRELRDAAFGNPALLYALKYFMLFDTVNYHRAVRELERLDKFDGRALARLMTEEGLHSSSPPRRGDFEESRYRAGRNLDRERYPDIRQLNAERTMEEPVYPANVNIHGPEVCDPGPYERYFLQAREAR